ncbi:MAG: amino acid adenylation domain-containing protein, partial [bacterium]|nr:amino acid adenylation domain-containing protein [bacterium]
YTDFAVWQQEWLQSQEKEKQLAYWREQLDGAPPMLELPTDRPRPAVQTFGGAQHPLRLSRAAMETLRTLSQQEDATLFMTLLAAFTVLLGRYSGQQDVVVGSPIAGRNRREIEALIGFFINTLVLRTDLAGGPAHRGTADRDPSFEQLLAWVRRVALDAYAHQNLPFESLVDELQPQRDTRLHPLFQVMFALQNAPQPAVESSGLAVTPFAVERVTAAFDLTLSLHETAAGVAGTLEYRTDLFDEVTIRRLAGHFTTLLSCVVRDPGQRLSDLPLLSPAENHQLILEWNDTRSDYPRDRPIHEHFEHWAERTPDALAVVFGKRSLSYRQLNRQANQLAHHLRVPEVGRGAGSPETLTGIYLERSADTVVAILAVLKAGGTYLPLDLSYPPERLAFMLEDSGAPVLITSEELAATLPAEPGVTIVCLDRDASAIARSSDRNPGPAATARNLAYVIYTSGSTGRPKGIGVSHRAIARLVLRTDYVALAPDDRVAQVSTTSFDAATFELWGPLLHGASLVGVPKHVVLDPRAFAAALREQRATTLFLTTALFNQMAKQAPAAFAGLRYLLFGGEAVDPGWVREVLGRRFPGRLLHIYGPAESTTFTTWQRVREVPEDARTVPIGSPIANTEVYVLDRSLKPVPVGVAGELCTAGEGLARGYGNRPQLSAEKFVPHPFGTRPGERLYRTGDLVRTLPEGPIEFLGRIDHQVKLRGFRVELGEIEAVLNHHGGVRESVVVVAGAEGGATKRLVAYVVAGEPRPVTRELREFLKQALPDYMVPAVFVLIDALPLTPNGKVDRRALPAPAAGEISSEGELTAAGNPTEELLAGIWAEVLDRHEVGADDNFFDLGGHSLLATQVVSRVRETLGVELPLRKLFEASTLAELARMVESAGHQARGLAPPPLVPVGRDQELPLAFAQPRLWFLDQFEPASAAYNLPTPLRLSGAVSVARFEWIFNALGRRHEVLR